MSYLKHDYYDAVCGSVADNGCQMKMGNSSNYYRIEGYESAYCYQVQFIEAYIGARLVLRIS